MRCPDQALESLNVDAAEFGRLADSLRVLSGLFDQASRSASSM